MGGFTAPPKPQRPELPLLVMVDISNPRSERLVHPYRDYVNVEYFKVNLDIQIYMRKKEEKGKEERVLMSKVSYAAVSFPTLSLAVAAAVAVAVPCLLRLTFIPLSLRACRWSFLSNVHLKHHLCLEENNHHHQKDGPTTF